MTPLLLAFMLGVGQAQSDTTRGFLQGGEQEIYGHSDASEVLPARLAVFFNGAIPRAANDGALWSGRGLSTSLRAGFRVSRGPLVVVIAPEILWTQNSPFEVFSGETLTRSSFSSPFHPEGVHSMDLPLRRGSRSAFELGPGGSGVFLDLSRPGITVGLTAAPTWWGPSVRNALLLSHQAPGIPRVFTSGRHSTALGRVEWNWFTGVLTESPYFDRDPSNDRRSLGGVAVALSPRVLKGLTVGAGHLGLMPWEGSSAPGVATLVGLAFRGGDLYPDDGETAEIDALSMLFASWSIPESGFEFGLEVAWQEAPGTLDDWLTKWAHTRAVTLSFQWRALPGSAGAGWYAEGESTSLDQTRTRYDVAHPPDFYSGRADPHGFTQRGQLLGALAGPGGQSVWAEAGRRISPFVEVGIFAARHRYENDAATRQQYFNFRRRDAAIEGGVRVRAEAGTVLLNLTAGAQHRVNYLFQNGGANPLGLRTVDVTNPFMTLSMDWAW